VTFVLTLPYPKVSGNHKNRMGRGRIYTTKDGKEYNLLVKMAVVKARMAGQLRHKIESKVHVTLEVAPPDRRRRDKDNVEKVVFDALTEAGVWADDSLIGRKVHEDWHDPDPGSPGGWVKITMEVTDG